jgi:hypothetical protein
MAWAVSVRFAFDWRETAWSDQALSSGMRIPRAPERLVGESSALLALAIP